MSNADARLGFQVAAIASAFLPAPFGLIAPIVIGTAGALLFPPEGVDAPRPDIQLPTTSPGHALPRIYGTGPIEEMRLAWISDPIFDAIEESPKGGASVVVGWHIYVSFRVNVCQGPATILQIYRQGELIYDALGTGPTFDLTGTLRLYDGTSGQLPDSAEIADVGADFAPAHQGLAGFVIERHDIADTQSFPIFRVVVASSTTPAYPLTTLSPTKVHNFENATISADGSRIVALDNEDAVSYDVAAEAIEVEVDATRAGDAPPILTAENDLLWVANRRDLGDPDTELYLRSADAYAASSERSVQVTGSGLFTSQEAVTGIDSFDPITGASINYTLFASNNNVALYRTEDAAVAFSLIATWSEVDIFPETIPNLAEYIGLIDNDIDTFYATSAISSTQIRVTEIGIAGNIQDSYLITHGLTILAGATGAAIATYEPTTNSLIFLVEDSGGGTGYLIRYELDDGTITTLTLSVSFTSTYNNLSNVTQGPSPSGRLWIHTSGTTMAEVDLLTMTELRTVNATSWGVTGVNGLIYDRLNHALWTQDGSQDTQIMHLDKLTGAASDLGTITKAELTLAGIDVATDLDTTAIDSETVYFAITKGDQPIRSFLEVLYDLHNAILAPNDWGLLARYRGGTVRAAIPEDDLGAHEGAHEIVEPIEVDRVQRRTLPRNLMISYKDSVHFANETQFARRSSEAIPGRSSAQVVYPGALEVDQASAMVRRKLAITHNTATPVSTMLQPKYLALEAGDVVTMARGSELLKVELRETPLGANMITEVKGNLWDDAPLSIAGDGVSSGILLPTIQVRPAYVPIVIDGPLLRDQDERAFPVIYVGAYPAHGSTRYAALVQVSPNGTDWTDLVIVDKTQQPVAGTLAADLPSAATTIYDRTNALSVDLFAGDTLSSAASEAAIEADRTLNGFAIQSDSGAWEYGQFVTATGSGPTALTTLIRGARNTENHLVHDTGKLAVFPSKTTLQAVMLASADIGAIRFYRCITVGRIQPGRTIAVTHAGRSKKPAAPSNVSGTLDGSNNWAGSFDRESRFEAAHGLGSPILGESIHQYDLAFLDASEGTEVWAKTITPAFADQISWTLTSAEQTANLGGVQNPLYGAFYQVGSFGRGEPLYFTLNG
jgi:hypothetical protein